MDSMSRRHALAGGGALVLAGAGAYVIGYRRLAAMGDYDVAVAATRAAMAQNPSHRELVRFATLAPNGHNTQPWRFRIGADRIDILPDFARRTPVVDPDDHHLFVSLGAAAENLAIAAAASGHPAGIAFDPSATGAVRVTMGNGPAVASPLFGAIRHRQSTRSDYDRRPLGATDLNLLAQAASVPGVDVVLITDWARIAKVTDLVVAGNSAQMGDAVFIKSQPNAMNISADIDVALHRSWFDPKTIRVTTDGGKVKLTGSVHTPGDRFTAGAAAWGSPGATIVENDLVIA